MRLVFLVHLGAEGFLRLVENHREMGWAFVRLHFLEELPQHAAEAVDGINMRAVRCTRLEPDRVVGAKDVPGTVHQEDVVPLLERPWRCVQRNGCGCCDFSFGFGGCWHGVECGPGRRVNQSARKCSHRKCVFSHTSRVCWRCLLCRRIRPDRTRFVTFMMDFPCALP